jgi:hypothetical protein
MSEAGIFYNHLHLTGGSNRLIMLMSLVGMMLDQQLVTLFSLPKAEMSPRRSLLCQIPRG